MGSCGEHRAQLVEREQVEGHSGARACGGDLGWGPSPRKSLVW